MLAYFEYISIVMSYLVNSYSGSYSSKSAYNSFFFGSINVGVFGPPTSKFVFACPTRMVCSEDTMVYTGSGGTSLRPVRCCLCYRHLICSMGYEQAREGEDPKSLVEGVNGC